jgi:LPS O-antigen subunit length determinant protein (WzzB/FepE family)
MDTATKSKTQQVARSTDRVLEALATLSALLDRTMNEVKVLEGDFQAKMLEAVKNTEAAQQAHTDKRVEQARDEIREELKRRFQTELQTALGNLRSEFQTERERLNKEFETERERLNKELKHAVDAASKLQVEKTKLTSDVQHARDAATVEIEKLRTEAAAAMATATKDHGPVVPEEEIARVENQLSNIVKLVENPETELSVVIRKNVEKLELEAYLKGIRYALKPGKGKGK